MLMAMFVTTAGVSGRATFQRFYAGGAVYPGSMIAAPDGRVWFTWEHGLGRVDLDGSVRLYRIAGASSDALTVAADGALWFVSVHHQVGRFSSDGNVSLMRVRDGTHGTLGGITRAPRRHSLAGQPRGRSTRATLYRRYGDAHRRAATSCIRRAAQPVGDHIQREW